MTRIEAVIQQIHQGIAAGTWPPGARIWPIRTAAAELKVSKNTVAEAYDRMVALGQLEARVGSGFYVPRATRRERLPKALSVAQAVDAASLLREQLIRQYEVRIGEGRPPHDWAGKLDFHLPAAGRSSAEDNEVHGYGNPWGFIRLREYLSRSLHDRQIHADPEHILTTMGANHALDLIARQLLEPGDTVLVDSPGYYPLFAKLHLGGVQIIGVKRLVNGPDIDDLNAKAARYQPKIFFTQSQAHNPTGSALTLPVGHRILLAATQHRFLVVEDDPFADILPADSPRLASLDQLERVIYVGTFSKTLSAGLRVGYLACNATLARALCDLKMLTIASSGDIAERMLYEFIASGQYLKHLRKLRHRVFQATGQALDILHDLGLEVFCEPTGCFYLWVHLRPGDHEEKLVQEASEHSIFIAPGHLFTPDRHSTRPAMRLNIAYAAHPKFIEFMKRR
ncbi:PLP-dependent aminotransferase family protein [Castellaniella sp.]|uniref:aminotransferase-like domain-containing protein n=1 Tax=Castellaniella sp. TaxID=1955812 RepID=UPI002AFF017E|nr:PLP-dependent aminotransferase family protein [Castellaniella sp.]